MGHWTPHPSCIIQTSEIRGQGGFKKFSELKILPKGHPRPFIALLGLFAQFSLLFLPLLNLVKVFSGWGGLFGGGGLRNALQGVGGIWGGMIKFTCSLHAFEHERPNFKQKTKKRTTTIDALDEVCSKRRPICLRVKRWLSRRPFFASYLKQNGCRPNSNSLNNVKFWKQTFTWNGGKNNLLTASFNTMEATWCSSMHFALIPSSWSNCTSNSISSRQTLRERWGSEIPPVWGVYQHPPPPGLGIINGVWPWQVGQHPPACPMNTKVAKTVVQTQGEKGFLCTG